VAIWELLAENYSIQNLVENIKENFADVPGIAQEEIQTFINDLSERGFIGFEVLPPV